VQESRLLEVKSILTYLFAVLAACANAASSVLQRKANRRVSQKQNLSVRLIWSLFHQPVWFAGVLAVIAGFLLQATALSGGELAVVEPVLVLELPATLILASWVFRSRLRRREWSTTAAMAAGLAGLMFFLAPSAGRSAPSAWYVWVAGILINLTTVGVLMAWARRRGQTSSGSGRRRPARAAVLGVAAGAQFGLTATLMKGMTGAFSQGFGALFSSWQLYGMVASGLLGMFLLQSAMNAGRLISAQPCSVSGMFGRRARRWRSGGPVPVLVLGLASDGLRPLPAPFALS
jgi:drug/metabolite transporter (DMT)-like permease